MKAKKHPQKSKKKKRNKVKSFFLNTGKILLWVLSVLIVGAGTLVYLWTRPIELTDVPDLTGKTKEQAVKILKKEGFYSYKFNETMSDAPTNHVIRTNPPAGTPVKSKSSLEVMISSGDRAPIKDYRGKLIDSVKKDLMKIYKVKEDQIEIEYEYGNFEDKDRIVQQSPLDTFDYRSGKLKFVVSKGAESFDIGNYQNKTVTDARDKLRAMGVPDDRIEFEYVHSKSTAPGLIISNTPSNAPLKYDSDEKVILKVSKSSEIKTREVPNLIGLSYEQAIAALKEIGFETSHISYGGVQSTKVISQSIDAGKQVYAPEAYISFEMQKPQGYPLAIDQIDWNSIIKMPIAEVQQTLNQLGIRYSIKFVETKNNDQLVLGYTRSNQLDAVELEVGMVRTPEPSSSTSDSSRPH